MSVGIAAGRASAARWRDVVPWTRRAGRVGRAERAERVLATVLFTDLVGSTELAARIGDRAFAELLDRHDRVVRRELARFGGREVKTLGDGFMATFSTPGRAIQCAVALSAAVSGLGLTVRAGLHCGECDRDGNDLRGMAVHIAARVADLATAGEVVVTSTVREVVIGTALDFADRGVHQLRGVPGDWRVFAAVA